MLAQETGKIGTVARAGASAGYLDEIAAIPHGASVDLRSTGQSLWEAGAVICNDLWQANAIPGGVKAVEAAQKFNVRSYLLLPLCCERGLVGELRLYAAEPGFFSAEEKKLATEVAESICFALESLERKRKQQKVETELRMNRERLELVLDATQDAYGDWNLESGDIQENPRYDALLGYEPYELPRRSEDHYSRIHPDDAARVARGIREFEASGKDLYSDEYRMRCKSGEYIWVFCRAKVVRRTPGGLPARVVGTLADITDRKKLEDQFRQAQKLESMGRLAGGVAHDFNNLLTVINGYSALLMTRSSEADPARRQLAEIRMAGERAAELTRQLLTFSRNSVTEPRLLKLNAAAADSENLLRRLTPDNIDFEASFEALRDEVVIDPGQVQQVLMNLVVNACDAMPAGGRLTVRTANLEVTPGDVPEDSVLTSGAYVLLEVTDTGTGMDEETIRHIFEPFFTTKDVGKGTGLGLSTVYGIVRQCGGFVRVESAPGAGSKFRIHFPLAADGILPHGAPLKGAAGKMTGSETVLVVEDQDTVRNFAVETLRTYGYSVLAARSGAEALEMAKQQAGPVDLLLTDVVMPSMNGKTVEQELRKTRPATKVIYMSGYADETAGVAAEIGPETGYLQKPFSPEALAAKVRCALDRAAVSHTILVVEDEEAVRAVFEEFLGKKHKLLLACNGRDALRMLQAGPMPDLVVTDLVMPDMEGVETIREIRRRLPGTKIIAMSGAFGGQFLKTAELLGADATLAKPIHPEVLDQMIEDVLARVSSN
jgi:PAS domain S-box-containing protein